MIVECSSVEEFCRELSREAMAATVRNAVRVRIDRWPEQSEGVSYKVGFWATAVIQGSEFAYLLELGLEAGTDWCDGEPDPAGSRQADAWREQVRKVCEERGLILAGGKWE